MSQGVNRQAVAARPREEANTLDRELSVNLPNQCVHVLRAFTDVDDRPPLRIHHSCHARHKLGKDEWMLKGIGHRKDPKVIRELLNKLEVYADGLVGVCVHADYPHENTTEITSAKDATFMHGSIPSLVREAAAFTTHMEMGREVIAGSGLNN